MSLLTPFKDHQTVAQREAEPASVLRRCLVSRECFAREDLLRFVIDPQGVVTFDVCERLPGRGLWVRPQSVRQAVAQAKTQSETQVKTQGKTKNLFARAAKMSCTIPQDLEQRVADALKMRLLRALGLARKRGILILGLEKIQAALGKHKTGLLMFACDVSPRTKTKYRHAGAFRRLCFESADLAKALGRANVVALYIHERRSARLLMQLIDKLDCLQKGGDFKSGELSAHPNNRQEAVLATSCILTQGSTACYDSR